MLQKLHTGIWFAKSPGFWRHAAALTARKLCKNYDKPELREKARCWAERQTIPYAEAFGYLGIEGSPVGMDTILLAEGRGLAQKSSVKMGGAGHLDLIYDAVRLSKPRKVIETGVAYGYSSLAILGAMSHGQVGELLSVDMPYAKAGNERWVGIAVPERLHGKWTIIRQPDRPGLKRAVKHFDGEIDLCHYDSDKSWWGRAYAFPILWRALKKGGILISDDIQDNLFFRDFATAHGAPFAVTHTAGKYIGIIRKP